MKTHAISTTEAAADLGLRSTSRVRQLIRAGELVATPTYTDGGLRQLQVTKKSLTALKRKRSTEYLTADPTAFEETTESEVMA